MNEETKAKVKQITEMISIYQTSIEGADPESMKLLKEDLLDKEQELNQIKEELENELDEVYKKASAIDPEVNQLENEKQEVINALEDIADLLLLIPVEIQIEESEPEEKEVTEEDEESEVIEEISQVEESEEIQEIEQPEDPEIIEETKEEELLELKVEEVEEEKEEEEEEEEEEEQQQEQEVSDTTEPEIFKQATLQIKEPSKTYKKIAQTIVKSRIETIQNPKQALEDSTKTAEALLEQIKKNFQADKLKIVKKEEQAS